MKAIVLTAGTEHVPYGDLARLIADALWPDKPMKHAGARLNLEDELRKAVDSGMLPVKDPLTLGPHTFPMGAALDRALVTVGDLREFVAGRGLNVWFLFSIAEDGGTTDFLGTQAQYDEHVAYIQAKRQARQAFDHFTMYEAAEVLSSVNGRDAMAFLQERMVPAANTGALVVLNPTDGGPVVGRVCRPYSDWATPSNIDDWLTRAKFDYRWPIHATALRPDAPATPKNQRPDLLAPLIEAAQRGENEPFSVAVIWPKLRKMAVAKTDPFLGVAEDGLQWIDGNDDPQFLSKNNLSDRLRRMRKRSIASGSQRQPAVGRDRPR